MSYQRSARASPLSALVAAMRRKTGGVTQIELSTLRKELLGLDVGSERTGSASVGLRSDRGVMRRDRACSARSGERDQRHALGEADFVDRGDEPPVTETGRVGQECEALGELGFALISAGEPFGVDERERGTA